MGRGAASGSSPRTAPAKEAVIKVISTIEVFTERSPFSEFIMLWFGIALGLTIAKELPLEARAPAAKFLTDLIEMWLI
jgi:hypothetical protein